MTSNLAPARLFPGSHARLPRMRGFTLIELMVTVAVLAVALMIAIPSFKEGMVGSKLNTLANNFVASLHLARSEAIKRNARAVLCPSADGTSCADSGGWQQGWVVFHDANNNAALDAGEFVILKQPAMRDGFRLTGGTTVSKYISYAPTGATKQVSGALQPGTLTLCRDGSGQARDISIAATGRVRTEKKQLSSCP